MKYHGTLCALALSVAVAAGWSDAHARTPQSKLEGPGRKLGHCFLVQGIATPEVAATGASTTLRAKPGKVITRVSLKAGNSCFFTPEGTQGTWTQSVNGTPCYSVAGLGTATATVTKLANGRNCVGLGTLQFLSASEPAADSPPPVSELGNLVVCSNAAPGQSFGIAIFASTGDVIALFEVPSNGCTPGMQFEDGSYTVSQGIPDGLTVSSVSADPADHLVSSDPASGGATVLVSHDTRTTVTYSNVAQ